MMIDLADMDGDLFGVNAAAMENGDDDLNTYKNDSE